MYVILFVNPTESVWFKISLADEKEASFNKLTTPVSFEDPEVGKWGGALHLAWFGLGIMRFAHWYLGKKKQENSNGVIQLQLASKWLPGKLFYLGPHDIQIIISNKYIYNRKIV